jgi:hypothetical protein
MQSDTPSSKTDQTQEPGKPYTSPRLVDYGDIREITRATGGTLGMNDGGAGKDKTG